MANKPTIKIEKNNLSKSTSNIFVLSIGINLYLAEGISNLSGCVADVFKLKQTLQERFNIPDEHYMVCTDEGATRSKIIEAIKFHFGKLNENDIALFHFSGHGSWEPTHSAFVEAGYEPKGGRNEVLVCYDSQVEGVNTLADKELRLLISEIQDTGKGLSGHPIFYSIFDCCHSGSILRDSVLNSRMAPSVRSVRPLWSYLSGQYQEMYHRYGRVDLPGIDYISMTACSPQESAIEDSEGGYFTSAIIEVIENKAKSGLTPTFAEIHFLSRTIVQRKSNHHQNPYFEYCGKVDPHLSFLLNEKKNTFSLPELLHDNDDWMVNLGAVHGIEYSAWKTAEIDIFDKNDFTESLGKARLKEVLVERTIVVIEWKYIGFNPSSLNLCIALYPRVFPFRLKRNNDEAKVWGYLELVMKQNGNTGQIAWDEYADYELEIQGGLCLINYISLDRRKLIVGINEVNKSSVRSIFNCMKKIIKWENTRNILTPKSSTILPEQIGFDFTYWNQYGKKITLPIGVNPENNNIINEIQIPFRPNHGYIFYRIEVKNNFPDSKGLYFYLIHLGEKFEISQKNESYLNRQYKREKLLLYDSKKSGKALGIDDPSVGEIMETYLLIASQEPLVSPYLFHQEGLDDSYGRIVSLQDLNKTTKEVLIKSDSLANWAVKRLDVKIIKDDGAL